MSNTTATKQRKITVIVRYAIKKDAYISDLKAHVKAGDVILYVENDKGTRYYTILRRGGTHFCSCPHVPSKKSPACYHINYARQVENERAAQLAAKRKALQEIEELEAIVAQVEQELAQEQAAKASDMGERGALSSNRGFSLMR
jgi:hypothetical protein